MIWLLFVAVPAARTVVVDQIRRRRLSSVVWFGMAVGGLLAVTDAVALVLLGAYERGQPHFDPSGVLALIVWVTIVATTEEMMLRGLLLTRLKDLIGQVGGVAATAASAALRRSSPPICERILT